MMCNLSNEQLGTTKKIWMLFKVKIEYGERRERKRDEGVGERERAVLLHGCMVIRGRELPEAHGRRATVADIYRTHRRWDTG